MKHGSSEVVVISYPLRRPRELAWLSVAELDVVELSEMRISCSIVSPSENVDDGEDHDHAPPRRIERPSTGVAV
jgi:hypothetical protein